jgi:hypothetical protein
MEVPCFRVIIEGRPIGFDAYESAFRNGWKHLCRHKDF